MRMGDYIGHSLSCLSIDREPQDFTLRNYWIFAVLLRIEANLVVEDEDEFVLKEFSDFSVALAIRSISAPLKLNVEERSFVRIEVTEQIQVFFIGTHQFLFVEFDFWIAWTVDWMEFTGISIGETQLFVRAWMWRKWYSAWVIASIILRPPEVMIEDELTYCIIENWLWVWIVSGEGSSNIEPFIIVEDIVWVKLGVWYCW